MPVRLPAGRGSADQGLTERLVDELRALPALPALAGEAPGIAEAAGHALLPGGKLLRPLLLVYSAAAVGGDIAQIMPAAAGLECAHAGSLVHDDLVDGDDLRCGREAVHGKFGFATALVTGNALFFAWFEALGRCVERGVPHRRIVKAMRIQAETGRQVCEGAALEVAMAGSLAAAIHFMATSARYLTEHKPDLAAVPTVTTTPTPVLWDPDDTTPPPYPDIAWWWKLLD